MRHLPFPASSWSLIAILSTFTVAGCGDLSRDRGGGDGGTLAGDGSTNSGADLASTTNTIATVVIAPNTPQNAPSMFGGSDDATLAPVAVYPPSGALIPPNLNMLEFQWTASTADLFEVSLQGPGVNLQIYTTCPPISGGCALLPDEKTWMLLSQAAHGQQLQLTLRGTLQSGGGVGTSPSQPLSFADEDMLGGLYYWAAATGGVYRYDFGLRNQTAESFYTPAQAGGVECVGCHALSRDGKRIAVGLNAPVPEAQLRLLDVATRKDLFDQGSMFGGGSNFEAITPDGLTVATTETSGLTLRDSTTGAVIGANPALDDATMPDFSPDGKQVVFARGSVIFGSPAINSASIFTAPFSGTTFGGAKQIVTGGGNNYYPAFSPDGQFIAFNRSQTSSYDASDARLMVVSSTTGAPIDLSAVNTLPGNSWPKWSPFTHHFDGATIFWISFSSRRSIGLRPAADTQIWMVPVDAGKLAAGQDPGYPPIWLPFQDPTTGNHIPQWVETVVRAPCSQVDQSDCQAGEMCVDGQCVPGIM